MAMTKRLSRHGNSLALVIDRPILDLLGIDKDTPLTVTTDGRALLVSPRRGPRGRKELRGALDAVNRRHGRTLRRLAE